MFNFQLILDLLNQNRKSKGSSRRTISVRVWSSLLILHCLYFTSADDCQSDSTFELITGFVFSSTAGIEKIPGLLVLTECLEICRTNSSCQAINYETGLCVLFSTNADTNPGALSPSQFPVFTVYAHKVCVKGAGMCQQSSWSFERVMGFELRGGGVGRRKVRAATRQTCMEACLKEHEFKCRSANYNNVSGECELNDINRLTSQGAGQLRASDGNVDYLENECFVDTMRMCEFQKNANRVLKTVDSVYQNVSNHEECRQLCVEAPYRCRTFDWGVTGDHVCRLSHHTQATLTHIQEPYLDGPLFVSYQLTACFHVSVECRAAEMVAKIRTNKLFDGKVYARTRPKTCGVDVNNSLTFELKMAYSSPACEVKKEASGTYTTDIVLQHHDMIVTNQDVGMSVHCRYDLQNKSVSNGIHLSVQGNIFNSGIEEANVTSPTVVMKITDRNGADLGDASVGDPLSLRFYIAESSSPYEIFVRELIASDGLDSEILLIDSLGCPTDVTIMGALSKVDRNGQLLAAPFDAFKFPSTDVVQFKALVTPCLPSCAPVECNVMLSEGREGTLESLGRRRRWVVNPENHRHRRNSDDSDDSLPVSHSIRIIDTFGFSRDSGAPHKSTRHTDNIAFEDGDSMEGGTVCMDFVILILACSFFLLAQVAVMVACVCVWQKRRTNNKMDDLGGARSIDSLYNNFSRR